MTTPHIRAELIPWDDPQFVQEYERAREQAIGEGLTINGPKAGRQGRTTHACRGLSARDVVEVERTVDEALQHAARWTVRRDGLEAPASGRLGEGGR